MKCFISSCENKSHKRPAGVSFHKFPKIEELRRKWIEAIGTNVEPVEDDCICSEHFLYSDLFQLDRKTLLYKEAIPKLKLDNIVIKSGTSLKIYIQPTSELKAHSSKDKEEQSNEETFESKSDIDWEQANKDLEDDNYEEWLDDAYSPVVIKPTYSPAVIKPTYSPVVIKPTSSVVISNDQQKEISKLNENITRLENKLVKKNKEIKRLQQIIRRRDKTINKLKETQKIKEHNFIKEEIKQIIL